MRTELEVMETTEERRERLLEQRREMRMMRALAKKCCMWLSGAAFVMVLFACGADMEKEAIWTGVIGFLSALYGLV